MALAMPHVEGVEHRYADVDGLRVHYAEAGEGDPVILQHGWPQHWWVWRDLIGPLAERFRVICPDMRGFGWTDAPRSGYDKPQLARDTIGLLDALGIERVRYIGHDWGGFTGFVAALYYPERFERFMPLSIPPPWPSPGRVSPRTLMQAWYQVAIASPVAGPLLVGRLGFPRRILEAARKAGTWSEDELRTYEEAIERPSSTRASVNLYRTFLLRELGPLIRGKYKSRRLSVPTRLLLGRSDPLGKALTDEWRDHADDMEVELVEGASHFLPEEKPEVVLERALRFLP